MYFWIDVWELISLLFTVAGISFCLGAAFFLYLFNKRKKKGEKK